MFRCTQTASLSKNAWQPSVAEAVELLLDDFLDMKFSIKGGRGRRSILQAATCCALLQTWLVWVAGGFIQLFAVTQQAASHRATGPVRLSSSSLVLEAGFSLLTTPWTPQETAPRVCCISHPTSPFSCRTLGFTHRSPPKRQAWCSASPLGPRSERQIL